MSRIDDTGAHEKALRFLDALENLVRDALPVVAEVIVADVMSRTPTPQEEYDTLMRGDGNPEGVQLVPLSGDQSGDTDGRVRLKKDADSWLADLNSSPTNVQIDESTKTVRVGNRFVLLEKSFYSYKNLSQGTSKRSRGEADTGKWYDKGPYFLKFEYGSIDVNAIVQPRYPARKGGKYPLEPDEDTNRDELFSMRKPINARGMYTVTRAVVRDVLKEVLSTLAPGRSNLT